MQVVTTRSVVTGVASGALVAAAVGQLLGASWGLAGLNGLAAGALALGLSIVVGDGRFAIDARRRPGVRILALVVVMVPAFTAANFMELELARGEGFALGLLLMLTGFAAHSLGGILATLEHLDDAAG